MGAVKPGEKREDSRVNFESIIVYMQRVEEQEKSFKNKGKMKFFNLSERNSQQEIAGKKKGNSDKA